MTFIYFRTALFTDHMFAIFLWEYASKRILKIGQYLVAKM